MLTNVGVKGKADEIMSVCTLKGLEDTGLRRNETIDDDLRSSVANHKEIQQKYAKQVQNPPGFFQKLCCCASGEAQLYHSHEDIRRNHRRKKD